MLAVARSAAEKEGATIEFREGPAEDLPFADGSFDLVTCQHAFQFFADREAAAGEIRRVLAPGGRVAVATWQGLSQHPFYAEIDALMVRRFGLSGVGQIFAFETLRLARCCEPVFERRGDRCRSSAFPHATQFLAMETTRCGGRALDAAPLPRNGARGSGRTAEGRPRLQRYVRDGRCARSFAQLATGQKMREAVAAKNL
jgi:SAM-dependent methyltransferase